MAQANLPHDADSENAPGGNVFSGDADPT